MSKFFEVSRERDELREQKSGVKIGKLIKYLPEKYVFIAFGIRIMTIIEEKKLRESNLRVFS